LNRLSNYFWEPENGEEQMRNLIPFIAAVLGFMSLRCNDKGKQKRKQYGEFTVEASFNDKNEIDGIAKFYNQEGILTSVENYSNGIRNGNTVHYYSNGLVKDSIFFDHDIMNGFQSTYDSTGNLRSRSYQFYGHKMGPQTFFSNGLVKQYFFVDFNRDPVVDCDYDSSGNLSRLSSYSARPSLYSVISNTERLLDLFMYLPVPPGANVEFKVGITNDKKQDKFLFAVGNSRVIFDTLLPHPPAGWYYFVSSSVNNYQNSINKVYMEVLNLP
jgi:hypothetical protein